jgi:hypothetical protein
MNLDNQFLDEWFVAYNQVSKDFRDFPFGLNYPAKYNAIADKLTAWVHPYVNQGSMMKDGGFLTDHGPEHIKTVIKRATQLVVAMEPEERLNPFEVYVLLMAIHVHDVGNILSRKGHEMNSIVVIDHLKDTLVRYDRIEWAAIYDIASAHGGEEKDKISKLPENPEPIHNIDVRFQLLAAILKFADELAEDSSRAARYLLFKGKLPEYSAIYHEYALSLHSVKVKSKDRLVEMHFNIEEEKLHEKYKKKIINRISQQFDEKPEFLINEIYLRTLKAHFERLYCMRFMRPFINIDKIRVFIKVSLNKNKKLHIPPPQGTFDLIESGIDEIHMGQIFEMCPELENWHSEKLSNHIKAMATP